MFVSRNYIRWYSLAALGRATKFLVCSFLSFFLFCTTFVNIVGEKKDLKNPVFGATIKSFDSTGYWHSSWGTSVVHKGIDIFASQKTVIKLPFNGLVLSSGYGENSGNFLYILGPYFRIYYFAHLNEESLHALKFICCDEQIGHVGNSGNAISKPYHLHFSIFSLFPLLKNYSTNEEKGWMKMFYLDPAKSLKSD